MAAFSPRTISDDDNADGNRHCAYGTGDSDRRRALVSAPFATNDRAVRLPPHGPNLVRAIAPGPLGKTDAGDKAGVSIARRERRGKTELTLAKKQLAS